ncbi:MAG: ISL3 family transposase [Oscillatoria sp. SIO1A7]|nr:ISL3 family transposase [Oscillatoria sp. SIO1A7]
MNGMLPFKCSNCRKYFTEKLDYIHAKRGHTIRYEQCIYEKVIVSSIGQVCREESLKYDEIKAMFDARAEHEKKNDWSRVERINIDEFSVRKGHKNFQTVIGDPDNRCLLDVIDGHTTLKVTEALMKQPIEIRENVKEVSVDMWGGFPKVIRQVFPNAQIIIDRFHVIKMVNEALNDLRKKSGVKIKNSRYLLLKNGADLSEEQLEELREILSLSPTLNIAYEMKENLRCIYEGSRTPKSGRKKIEKWRSARSNFVAKTLSDYIKAHKRDLQLLY